MFALDTNTVIHALKGKGEVRHRLHSIDLSELAVPSVVLYELEVGAIDSPRPSQRTQDLHRLLGVMKVLPFNRDSAEYAARVQKELGKAGAKIGQMDTLIAGTALAHGAVLVSHNLREFSRVSGLRVEDWF